MKLQIESQYKKIPANVSYIRADVGSCGDDYCNCAYGDIWAIKKDKTQVHLWTGNYYGMYDYSDETVIERLREELTEACDHYNIKIDLSSNTIWDWRGYRHYE